MVQFFQDHVLLGHLWWPKVKCWSVTPLKSSEVTRGHQLFLPITWDWEELETWKWSQCVCLINTQRLICKVTLWPWPEVNFLSWPFDVSLLTRGTQCRSNFISFVLSSKVFSEKPYGESVFFTFHDLRKLMYEYWTCVISDGKTLPERFMSYLLLI